MNRIDEPYPHEDAIVNIGLGIVLSFVTCGVYYFVWQYKQIKALNAWLDRDEFDFAIWLLLTIVTCGIFSIYYEYKMAKGINEIQENERFRLAGDLPLISLLLTLFGLGIVSIAIQQHEINAFYQETADL